MTRRAGDLTIDNVAIKHRKDYRAANNKSLARTHSMVAPLTIVRTDDKPQAKINLIRDLLTWLEFDRKDRKPGLSDLEDVFGFHADVICKGCWRNSPPT